MTSELRLADRVILERDAEPRMLVGIAVTPDQADRSQDGPWPGLPNAKLPAGSAPSQVWSERMDWISRPMCAFEYIGLNSY